MSEREIVTCGLCGEPMPPGEEMFNYHGYSGPCPKPPALAAEDESDEGAARPEGSGDSWAPPLRRPVPLATPQTETLLDVPHAEVDALVEAIYAERRALSPPDMERLQQRWDTRDAALRALVEQWKQESMKADADSFWEADQKAQALAGRASGLLTCAEALSRLLEQQEYTSWGNPVIPPKRNSESGFASIELGVCPLALLALYVSLAFVFAHWTVVIQSGHRWIPQEAISASFPPGGVTRSVSSAESVAIVDLSRQPDSFVGVLDRKRCVLKRSMRVDGLTISEEVNLSLVQALTENEIFRVAGQQEQRREGDTAIDAGPKFRRADVGLLIEEAAPAPNDVSWRASNVLNDKNRFDRVSHAHPSNFQGFGIVGVQEETHVGAVDGYVGSLNFALRCQGAGRVLSAGLGGLGGLFRLSDFSVDRAKRSGGVPRGGGRRQEHRPVRPYWWPVVRFCVGSALFFLGLEVAYRSELRGYRPKRVTNGLAVLSFLLAFGGIALALAGLL